jgi:NAD(P)-dependent dehydrogenase (short-subunit alcohol dehydrogenase family)
MTWNLSQLPEQTGKIVVITGGNSGIGYEAARGLAKLGAHIVLACRDTAKAQAALQSLRAEQPGAQLEAMALDLADLASVRDFAARLRQAHPALHLLINNASGLV